MHDYKSLLKIALPAMAENCLQMMMTVIDSYLVATLGLVAVSAVSVAGNIITIYQAIFIALGAAISARIAKTHRQLGKGATSYVISQAMSLTLYISLILGGLSLFFGEWLLHFLGTEDAVSHLGGIYLAWVGGNIFLLGGMTSLAAVLRAQGKTQVPMYISLIVNLLNALLSAIGIFILGWGIVGVALGTVLSRLIGIGLLYQNLPQKPQHFTWQLDKDLVGLALPAAGERLMMRAGDVVVVSLVVSLGTAVVAGQAIGEVLTQFNYLPGISVATATVILTAQAQGKNDPKQIAQIRKKSYWLALLLTFVISSSQVLLSPYLISLYTTDPQAIASAQLVVYMSFLGMPMTTGTLINTALWQGLGRAQLPFYATTFGMWGIRIGLGYFMVKLLGLGLLGVCLGTVLDNTFRWLFLARLYHQKGAINETQ